MNLRSIIENFPSIKIPPHQYHQAEDCMNPAYLAIEDVVCPLRLNEKRIWALCTNMTLATGVKNAEVKQGNTPMDKVVHVTKELNEKNRYGHPSLAIPEKTTDYDGSVYYAGWVTQRANNLVVYLHSGRYKNRVLTLFQKQCLEIYIGIEFLQAYGEQDIIFYDKIHKHRGLFDFFLSDKPFDTRHEEIARTYSPSLFEKIIALEDLGLLSVSALETILGEEQPKKSSSTLEESEHKIVTKAVDKIAVEKDEISQGSSPRKSRY
ncbi:MAG: hypothetical protein ABI597_00610 [Gammaproteobacteria bacterium]